jgi:hypothetical protein
MTDAPEVYLAHVRIRGELSGRTLAVLDVATRADATALVDDYLRGEYGPAWETRCSYMLGAADTVLRGPQ